MNTKMNMIRPNFILAALLMGSSCVSIAQKNEPHWKWDVAYGKYRDIEAAKKLFTDSIDDGLNVREYYYLRALCNYYLEDYEKGFADLNNAGSHNTINMPLETYHRGLTCFLMKYVRELRSEPEEEDPKQLSNKDYHPVNVCIVIDVSGSMYKDGRLERLKKSLIKIIKILRSTDKLSIVVFDHTVEYNLMNVDLSNRQEAVGLIGRLIPIGGTEFSAPVIEAYSNIKTNYMPDGKNQIIMATDGLYRPDTPTGRNSKRALLSMIKSNNDTITFSVIGIGDSRYGQGLMVEMTNKGNGEYRLVTRIEPNNDAIIRVLKQVARKPE